MNHDEFKKLVLLNQANIFRFLQYLGADWHTAEDLTQDVFVCVFNDNKEISHLEAEETGKWLRGIARNLFLMNLRKNKTKLVELNDASMDKAETVWKSEFLRNGDGEDVSKVLDGCLDKLPEKQRHTIFLRYEKSIKRKEMAKLLKMNEEGVKSLLRRIRQTLAKCIRQNLSLEGES